MPVDKNQPMLGHRKVPNQIRWASAAVQFRWANEGNTGERGDVGEPPLLIVSRRKAQLRKPVHSAAPDLPNPGRPDVLGFFESGHVDNLPLVYDLVNGHGTSLSRRPGLDA